MNFKNLIKKIALIGEAVAVSTIPGASAIDTAAHSIVNAKTVEDRELAIFNTAIASLDEIEAFNPDLIENEALFKDALINLHRYSIQLKLSLKK